MKKDPLPMKGRGSFLQKIVYQQISGANIVICRFKR